MADSLPAKSSRASAGLIASLFALWCQIFLATALMPQMAALDPLADAAICHTKDDGQPSRQPVHHDCALCVRCLLHVASAGLAPQSLGSPAPRARALAPTTFAPQAAPLHRPFIAAQPRGPPSLM